MADFAVSVKKWTEKAGDRAEEAFQEIALRALKRVKELTPVDTGYLRANWVDVLDEKRVPKPSSSQSEGNAIREAELGDVIFIVNPVKYARRIEYGFAGEDSLGRSYNQKGRGMMRQTILELPEIAKGVIREIRGK